jgi:hypothetical protein
MSNSADAGSRTETPLDQGNSKFQHPSKDVDSVIQEAISTIDVKKNSTQNLKETAGWNSKKRPSVKSTKNKAPCAQFERRSKINTTKKSPGGSVKRGGFSVASKVSH